ncbi:MAG: EamA family transporter RarD [Rubrivivax sp.]
MNPGLLYALAAFTIWGLFPLYFRQLAGVAPFEVVLHRSAGSLVTVLLLMAWLRPRGALRGLFSDRRRLGWFVISGWLLAFNWLLYVLAVQWGRLVEASLGFFINPLINVLVGVLVLRERLRPLQWLAVALAATGVAWLTWHQGRVPWLALGLSLTFAGYGLIRKTATLGAMEGLALESLLLAPVVLPLLGWLAFAPGGAFVQGHPALVGWVLLGGPLTAVPLLLFAAAARRLPLTTLGLVQYLSPTLTLLLGVWLFGEPFDRTRLVGFGFIWTALAVYSAQAFRR